MTCIVALLVMIYTQAALLEERALSKRFPTYYDYTCHIGESPGCLCPSVALSKQITHWLGTLHSCQGVLCWISAPGCGDAP